jgi:hypothetical protein
MEYRHNGNPRHNQGSYGWKPNVPCLKKPVITGQKKIGGKKHYTGEGGKVYEAVAFDKMFNTPGGIVKPNKTKYVRDRILY